MVSYRAQHTRFLPSYNRKYTLTQKKRNSSLVMNGGVSSFNTGSAGFWRQTPVKGEELCFTILQNVIATTTSGVGASVGAKLNSGNLAAVTSKVQKRW